MKKRTAFTRTLVGSLLAGSLLAVGATGIVTASPDGDCPKGARMERMAYHKDHKDGIPFERMFQRLNLSTEQQAQVKQIVDENRTALQQQRDALRDNRKALRELATSTAYDPQRVRTLADSQAKLQADMMVARTETFHRVYQVLTPEQQAEFAKLRAQRQERWEMRQRERTEQ